ncbi:hypothetical protein [Undibacterium pigrum]|uniref:Intein n=1 Tax=Undibacterium pigrum TaxID=401470 RepID=A0A318IZC1_9BURK|nr:hypothetical protein [Undibacterium pigrum]PXX41636.1 hypothetical protein DFR42_107288 [Undibacterium pigrum]
MSDHNKPKIGSPIIGLRSEWHDEAYISPSLLGGEVLLFGRSERRRNVELAEIAIGEEILVYCADTKEFAYSKVIDIQTQENVPSFLLYYEGFDEADKDLLTLEAACTLPVFVVEKGWTMMSALQAGDKFLSFDRNAFRASFSQDKIAVLQSKELTVFGVKKSGKKKKMYSIKLADKHSYCVGNASILVHDSSNFSLASTNTSNKIIDSQDIFSVSGCGNSELVVDGNDGIWEVDQVFPGFSLKSRCETTNELTSVNVQYRIFHQEMERCWVWYMHNGNERFVDVTCTQEFLIKERGWIRAVDLKSGDALESGSGNVTVISSIQTEWDGEPMDGNYYSFILTGSNSFCLGIDSEICVRGLNLKNV